MGAHKDRLIQAAELLGMEPDELFDRLNSGWQGDARAETARPAPEGFDLFAHWSAVHDGINVEIDAPEGLPLTVHVNDWRAVNVIIGTDDPANTEPNPFLTTEV